MNIKFIKFFLVSNILFVFMLLGNSVFAQSMSKEDYITIAKSYCEDKDYSRAIATYNQALNLFGNEGNIELVKGLILAYYQYAQVNFSKKEYPEAMNNYRSVIFLIKTFFLQNDFIFSPILEMSINNLNKCIQKTNFDMSISNRYNVANKLMKEKKYAAAGFEYSFAIKADIYESVCRNQLLLINKKYKNGVEIYNINEDMKNSSSTKSNTDKTNQTVVVDEISSNPDTGTNNSNDIGAVSSWEIYKNELLTKLKNHWDNRFKGQDYVVEVEIKVSNVGKLLSCNLIKSSNSSVVDKMAIKSVLTTYPFFSTDIQYSVKYNIKFDSKSGQIFISDPIDE